ncbi:hypothetical protein M422DRAFT_783433 [Sphaerobolus stellatus SS14]|uniref:SLC41A/MgtE integral membrane domain-containing protein n=1 Tax=Sphaerobolus stellatus (strain SS14) TaxID=990650 RepID=A0A0C9V4V8_SPHS4|nr:hypothetical protein M422DRAFT_783433 [Sphaerobolus stellatus SS14]
MQPGFQKSKEVQYEEEEDEQLELATLNGRHIQEADNLNYEVDGGDEDEAGRALLGSELSPTFHTRSRKKVEEQTNRQFVNGILIETVPTLFLTTIGLTLTGEMLERVAAWQALRRVNELYILIPMLNNLKGNLEMNLSSRLSTAANIGDLDDVTTRMSIILGNLSLVQVQALLVSLIAALLSFFLGKYVMSSAETTPSATRRSLSIFRRKPVPPPPMEISNSGLREFGVLLSTAMASASTSGMILGSFMCSLILNEHVSSLIYMGWVPLLGAMAISSGTGMVLDRFVNQYEGFGLLSIVIGGLPGAVGSVFVSRYSTALHAAAHQTYPDKESAAGSRNLLTTVTLFLVTLPVLLLFLGVIVLIGWIQLPPLFIGVFIPVFCVSVLISLTTARILTGFLWSRGLDPDTYALPIQTSLVDLTGQLMLVACYEIVSALGANVKSRPLPLPPLPP